ncbi:MAG: hypothetical protein H7070_16290 [Saprospiraceae bacterium]|nr:hypothetical protein [Pyrinomonadaceae bacterium]
MIDPAGNCRIFRYIWPEEMGIFTKILYVAMGLSVIVGFDGDLGVVWLARKF